MVHHPSVHNPKTYLAIDAFVNVAFQTYDSLFTPGRAIWTPAVLSDLHERFVLRPDLSNDKFVVKYKRQLFDAPRDTIQLAAEILFVQLVTPWKMGQETKVALISEVLSWTDEDIPFPQSLRDGFETGLVSDQSFMMQRPAHVAYLIQLLRSWHGLSNDHQAELLKDAWSFKSFATSVGEPISQGMQSILCYFVHPKYFEPITSVTHKQLLREAFSDRVDSPSEDDDRFLFELRPVLEAEFGPAFHYYREPAHDHWKDLKKKKKKKVINGDGPGTKGGGNGPDIPSPSLDQLADSLLLDRKFIRATQRLLNAKRQVIFYGPPGTGKTFVAQRLAAAIAGDPSRVRTVQFHPSYAYEDFIEGYRPIVRDGTASFRLTDGPLKRLATEAAASPDEQFVLVIDEFNRGNLSKVLGECYFLLEYRDTPVRLQYSEVEFKLPPNLLIIGTMNTADRSIALIDAALRRRFYFIEFFPDRWPVEGLLRRWLARENADLIWVADVVDLVNQEINQRHLAVGPSYFMISDLNNEWVELIWRHAVLPYLEEHFFGEPERVLEFTLDKVRARLAKNDGDPA